MVKSETSITLFGVGASPGIVVGPVLYLGRRKTSRRSHRNLDAAEIANECRRFIDTVELAERQLKEVRSQFSEHLSGYAPIIDTHILMLRDKMLYDRTLAIIEQEQKDAEWALERALNEAREAFNRIEDQYLRERVHDVEQVAERMFRLLAGKAEVRFSELTEKVIVAARDFAPEDVLHMRSDKILGFFTEKGGETSHTAIVARTLGVPSVVGAEGATRHAASGDAVILDGNSGKVIINPNQRQLEQYQEYQRQYRQYSEQVAMFTHLAAETEDGLRLKVEANIEMAEEAAQAVEFGSGGIGLFRSEYYYLSRNTLPEEEELYTLYSDLLSLVAPFPVTIRTLDVGGDKFMAGLVPSDETNPALGLRAIRYSLREPSVFKTQLRALLRASTVGNLRIMFPMITSLCEIKRIKGILAEVQSELSAGGQAFKTDIEIGIMIEVPSAVSIADVLAKEVNFFSIGTNDLIQYALAIDRGNEHVAHMYEPLHPAVLRMIRQVVEAGHDAGIEVGLCGEMAGDISYLPLLIGLGLDQLSMYPLAIPYVKRMVRSSTAEESEKIVQEVLRCASAQEVHNFLVHYLPERYPTEFGKGGVHYLRKCCCSVVMEEGQEVVGVNP